MFRTATSLVVFALIGCGSQPQTPVLPPPPPPAHVVPPEPVEPSRVEAVPEPVVPQPLADVGCSFGPAKGALISSLGFVIDGVPFARLHGTVAVEVLQVSENGQRAYGIVETESVRLAAEVDARSVRVGHTAEALPIQGWLELRSARIERAKDGTATMLLTLPRKFVPSTPVSSITAACSELTPMSNGRGSTWGDTQLRSGERAPLSLTPGGAPVGTLVQPSGSGRVEGGRQFGGSFDLEAFVPPDLTKLEERGGFVRVRHATESSAVVGWIPKRALDNKSAVTGLLGMLGSGEGGPKNVVCSSDVELLVASKAGRVKVGLLRANRGVPGAARAGGGFEVHLEVDYSPIAYAMNQPTDDVVHAFVGETDAEVCELR